MKFKTTKIKGLLVIDPDKFSDERGYFLKSFEKTVFLEQGINMNITQANHSFNKLKGTIRGMHMQINPFQEDKIIQCIKGKIFDVAIDLRKYSNTYGKWYGEELSEENKKIFYIPEGFAHGFQTLMDNSEVFYFMSGHYSRNHEVGFRWNDPYFDITWPMEPTVIAEKDRKWPLFKR